MKSVTGDTIAAPFSIVQVADYSPNYSGNFIVSLRTAAAEYRKRGFKPVWVFPQEARDRTWLEELGKEGESSVYILPRRHSGHIRYAWELARIARRENAAILHTHFSRFDIAAWVAKIVCALTGRHFELVWHVHSAFAPHPNRARLVLDAIKLGVLARTCRLVPVWEALYDGLVERGCPKEKMQVIPNGIDTARCLLRTRSRKQVREELKVTDDALVLLGLGWEPVRKGVDTMLEALAHARNSGRNPVLVLVGTDDRLQRFVDHWPERSVISSVRVIPAVEHIGDLHGGADVLVSASRAEGFPYSVAEAMINGLPVVSTRIPALAWAFEAPGIFFFEMENSRELAEVIDRIAKRTQDESRLDAELSRKFVEERYSVERWVRSVMQLYENLLPDDRDMNSRGARAQKEAAV
jgi:glycosyltransferase involved in cell wall biosynthesis